jgi:hypothetical protein
MSEDTGSERPIGPRRVVQALPFIIFALVALTVGLLATFRRKIDVFGTVVNDAP